MLKNVVLIVFAGLGVLSGQTQVDLKLQSKNIDFSAASATKPVKTGTSVPGTCGIGELFFDTSAPAGQNLYACTTTNVYTLQSGAGQNFLSGAAPPSGNCTTGQVYLDTANGNTWFCESPGTWEKVLATSNTGTFVMTGQNGANPGAPASGNTSLFFNSTGKVGQSVDDGGNVATMVRPTDCSATVQLVEKINSDGTVTCAIAGGPVTYNFPAGAGSPASPQTGAWWEDGSTSVVCPSGAPFQCYLHWNSGGSILAVTTSTPHLWVSGTVSITLKFQGNGSGNTVQPTVSSGCASNGSSMVFNAAQSFPSQATSGSNYSIVTLPSLNMAGCSADGILVLQLGRADSGGFLNLAEASITFNVP